ncbi:beta-galactosidase GalA [Sphingomonas morindae]|uniref:DUF4982 domain-containing protein n=1 Tax=Sphingomonas morindae TaxID=1541170 RepID=A0ABY4X5U2_9SPHN|nr:beta-galactosidase GalA [Sphingomonas morindae]USI72230.1 DUF4982 domain-containing protein [Sphingomonas morindae]
MIRLTRRGAIGAGGAAAALSAAHAAPLAATAPAPRETVALDAGWRFHLGHAADPARDFGFGLSHDSYAKSGEIGTPVAGAEFDARDWATVRLPHDWAVDLPFMPFGPPGSEADRSGAFQGFKPVGRRWPETSIGWYRRALPIAAADAGRRLRLEFDGVGRDCLVILNGFVVASNESGYAPFTVDITDVARPGEENWLVVRCDASLGEAWSYEGAGLYRAVRLVKSHAAHVRRWGAWVRADPVPAGAALRIATEIDNHGPACAARLRSTLIAPDGGRLARLEAPLDLAEWSGRTIEQRLDLRAPALWSPATPQLHRLITEVLIGGQVVDRQERAFGIRFARFDPDRGFFLNGQPLRIQGSCNHQDHAGVGFAVPDSLHAWRIEQLKAMGCNAYRSTHHPPPPAVLEACDRLGLLMLCETRQMSSNAEGLSQLERMVRQARGHACVFLWGIGNEEIHRGTPTGARIAATMKRHIRALDDSRPVTEALNGKLGQGAAAILDVMGCNYHLDEIDAFHAANPAMPMIGTETGSTVTTRGVYARDDAAGLVPAYDREFPSWASTAEQWLRFYAARPFLAGGFVWTGFDYRGEPTPFERWPENASHFGQLDSCGFPKDNFHYYRAWWSGETVLHLLPHWTWPGREGAPIEVWAHSNCDEVELRLNGRSLGRRAVERLGHAAWTVPYAPGRLEARGYRAGRPVARARRDTAGAPAALSLSSDRRRLAADAVAVVRVALVDRAGVEVPQADRLVSFALHGDARLLGVGNGDPRSLEADHATRRSTFNGLCMALVQAGPGGGAIALEARAEGLKPALLTLAGLG